MHKIISLSATRFQCSVLIRLETIKRTTPPSKRFVIVFNVTTTLPICLLVNLLSCLNEVCFYLLNNKYIVNFCCVIYCNFISICSFRKRVF